MSSRTVLSSPSPYPKGAVPSDQLASSTKSGWRQAAGGSEASDVPFRKRQSPPPVMRQRRSSGRDDGPRDGRQLPPCAGSRFGFKSSSELPRPAGATGQGKPTL